MDDRNEYTLLPEPTTMQGWRNLWALYAVSLTAIAIYLLWASDYPYALLCALLAMRCSYNAGRAHNAIQDAATGVRGTQDDESID